MDIDKDALNTLSANYGINVLQTDVTNKASLFSVIKNADLVISAVPGAIGFKTVEAIIEAGKNAVDISFMPEDFMQLDKLAKEKNLTIVADCGVAPGMANIILGHHAAKSEVESYKCLVGGLPVIREWPYEYKAVFSPLDVIEEYTRAARYVVNGKEVVKEALSESELVDFKRIGTLEAWNSDGLRSLISTMNIPDMIEKTLRYPGTIEYLKVLRETGFFSYKEINVKDKMIRPIDMTAELLKDKWTMKPGEEDFTIMRIEIVAKEAEKKVIYVYDLLDKFDTENDFTSMARTTGYTCTAVANLLIDNKFTDKGVNPPEFVGKYDENLIYVLNYLKDRNVIYKSSRHIGE